MRNIVYDDFFKELDQKQGEELYSALDTILKEFNSSNKVSDHNCLDNLATVISKDDFNNDYIVKLIDFIKTSCGHYNRLSAALTTMAYDKKRIMKVRWHIFDAMEKLSPEYYENLKSMPELINREADPEKPTLDIDEAHNILADKELKNFKWWVLSPVIIFVSMAGIYFSWNKSYFFPVILTLIAIILLFLIMFFLSIKRCPSCKRYFAQGKLILRSSFNSIPSLTSPGTSRVLTTYTMRLYSTSCKFCKHEWIVIRG
ncbi:MAG: hypothetical protein A2Y41_03855 [Spirochaetes bacterium GWB1_36_13]|nr:MAG: hypothetical protein A2Y41_03855 [Spirochaetes bacterium GWB1_36_13]